MVVSNKETSVSLKLTLKSMVGTKSRIWLTTSVLPWINAVLSASMALAPQPLLLAG